MVRLSPGSTLFPYTTLFRSRGRATPAPRGGDDRIRHRTAHPRGVCGHHRSEEHTSELQSLTNLVCRLLLEKKKLLGSFRDGASVDNVLRRVREIVPVRLDIS